MEQLSDHFYPNRSSYPIRIMQFGGGNFLRAFTNWMIEELNSKTSFAGNIAIIKPTEKGDYTALRKQNGLFHVVLNGIKNEKFHTETKLIQSVSKVIHPYHQWKEYLKLAENPDLRFIISNTTEAGIQFNSEDRFNDSPPKEFPAKLALWLYHRYQYFNGDQSKTCIILPLELIENNGEQLKSMLLAYANHWEMEDEFKTWIETQTYCNTLVDRIVSGYPKAKADEIEGKLGIKDELLVEGEYYHSWIIQGPIHVSEELPFAQTNLNVTFADDLEIHRKIKVRILNGAHTSMVPIGYLNGAKTVLKVMQNPDLQALIKEELFEEILPTLDYSKEELEKFANEVLDRFRNPSLHHKLLDISLNSTSKFVTRLLPSLLDYVKIFGKIPPRIAAALAHLILFYKGEHNGEIIPLRDDKDRIDFFKNTWESHRDRPVTLIKTIFANESIWEMNLNDIDGLIDEVVKHF